MTLNIEDGNIYTNDVCRVEESYSWHDDTMEIMRRITKETDEARLSNIAEHFEVDLSEIREFLAMKQRKQQRPRTNADSVRSMTDKELAEWISCMVDCSECEDQYAGEGRPCYNGLCCPDYWLDWLKQEAPDDAAE